MMKHRCTTCTRMNCADRTESVEGRSLLLCADYTEERLTNADRIRSMSDQELAELLRDAYDAGCNDASAWECGTRQYTFTWDEEWLRQPAEEVQSNA